MKPSGAGIEEDGTVYDDWFIRWRKIRREGKAVFEERLSVRFDCEEQQVSRSRDLTRPRTRSSKPGWWSIPSAEDTNPTRGTEEPNKRTAEQRATEPTERA